MEPLYKKFGCLYHKIVSGSKTISLMMILFSGSQAIAEWKVDKIKTSNPQYNSKRFLYAEKTARLELYKTATEWIGCFCVTSLPVPALPEDPTKSRITLKTDSAEEEIFAYRTAGGQKLLLPEETLHKILQAMKKGSSITLKTGRYTLNAPPLK